MELFISNVKPDYKSMIHFFDNQHNFFTVVDVHFSHRDQSLKAVLLFPYHQETFSPDRMEVLTENEWVPKKGDPHPYLDALSGHPAMHKLMNKIKSIEKKAKTQLENRFKSVVTKVAMKLKQEIQPFYPIECKVAEDYLSIVTKIWIGTEEITARAETNNYFPHTTNDKEFVEKLSQEYSQMTLNHIKEYIRKKGDAKKPQNVYIGTIPIMNPVAEEEYEHDTLYVSVHTEGYCEECKNTIIDNIHSSITIQLQKLTEHKKDLLIQVVGDTIVCPECSTIIEKEKLVVKDLIYKRVLLEEPIKSLHLLGNMNKQEEMVSLIHSAIDGEEYFTNDQERFWDAFSYIALQSWDVFIAELTRKELIKGLRLFMEDIDDDASKALLLKKLKKLSLTENQKEEFWLSANEVVVQYYLVISLFGWNMSKEMNMIGPNRAEFIFRFLPLQEELNKLRNKQLSELGLKNPGEVKKLQEMMTTQHQQIEGLKQENGRLTNKLGEAYKQISRLEQEQFTVSDEVRNKDDILKIQNLKGLIEELKMEIERLSVEVVQEVEMEEAGLTDEPIEQEEVPIDAVLKGKRILILGGYRSRQSKEEKAYTILTHDTRTIEPRFYELLKKADIIVVLTRFISHRAMWEAKEFAIIEQTPIYFTSFTNIPTILQEVVRKGSET